MESVCEFIFSFAIMLKCWYSLVYDRPGCRLSALEKMTSACSVFQYVYVQSLLETLAIMTRKEEKLVAHGTITLKLN